MTPKGRLQAGDVIRFGSKEDPKDQPIGLVLNVGRSECYSMQVLMKDAPENRPKLIVEAGFWHGKTIHYVNRRPRNITWAREWRQRYVERGLVLDL